jgi:hypothetical protein
MDDRSTRRPSGNGRAGVATLSEGRPGGRQPAASRPFAAAEPYHLLRNMNIT